MRISIVIPAHNEEQRMQATLESYASYFSNIGDEYEVVVVLNATKDKTEEIVKSMQKKYPMIRYLNLKKGGKGYAVIEGCKDALERKAELIGFVDADMATPPQAFHDLIRHCGKADAVIASRWMKQSIVTTKQTLLRRFLSRGFNMLVRGLLFLPFHDTQCGAKIFTAEALKTIIPKIGLTNWAFDVELLYQLKRKGFQIKEIPTIWNDKKDSKLNIWKVPLEMFLGIARIRLINSPLAFIVRAYDSLPESLKLHHRL